MKKFFDKSLLIIILVFGLFTLTDLNAQTAWGNNNADEVSVGNDMAIVSSGTIAGTDTLLSDAFEFSEYNDHSFITYPVTTGFTLSSGTVSTRKISCEILGSFENSLTATWVVYDTLMTSDSTATPTNKDVNLKNKHYPFSKLRFFGTTGNASSGIPFKHWIYCYKKD